MDSLQVAELKDAQKGIMYFLAKTEAYKKPSMDLGMISNFMSGTSILTDLTYGATSIINQTDKGRKVLSDMSSYLQPVKDLISSFFDAMYDHIAKTYGEGAAVLEWVGEFTTWAVSTLVGSLADLIPGWGYVQSAVDLYDGVKKSVTNAIKWLSQIYSGWGVSLLSGSPTIIAQGIAQTSATGLAGGLKDIAITSVKIGLEAAGDAAAGVGSLVNLVTGILQRIANLLNYAVQRFFIHKTLTQAMTHWNREGELKTNLHQFNQWFRRTIVCTPIFAALTINSGFCAHPYRFLSLIDDQDKVIDQAGFDKGVKHIEKLKTLSKDYAKAYSDAYKINFTSEDKVVSSRLDDIFS